MPAAKTTPYLTHEIGSLAKPEWRLRVTGDRSVRPQDVKDAQKWAQRLELDAAPLLRILRRAHGFTDADKRAVVAWHSRYCVRLNEKAGLDWVYDGEAHRSEMYHYPITHCTGFEFRGHCRSWDNKYWNKAAVVAVPRSVEPYHVDEFRAIKKAAKRPVKVPITGAYTLIDWSFDEHYLGKHLKGVSLGSADAKAARARARREFAVDVARNVVRPNVKALVDAGAKWVQIDEPAVTTHPDEVPLFVEAFNESVRGLTSKARFSVHICFSDYARLFPHILELKGCSEYAIELSNRDPWETGTDRSDRPGYHVLDLFAEHSAPGAVGLGVVDVHSDRVEPAGLVADRIRYATKVLGDAARVWPCTDCGLRTRTWDVSLAKMQAVTEGVRLVEGRTRSVKGSVRPRRR